MFIHELFPVTRTHASGWWWWRVARPGVAA
jgi:hypothetical protein